MGAGKNPGIQLSLEYSVQQFAACRAAPVHKKPMDGARALANSCSPAKNFGFRNPLLNAWRWFSA
jgi:hypothetical protein